MMTEASELKQLRLSIERVCKVRVPAAHVKRWNDDERRAAEDWLFAVRENMNVDPPTCIAVWSGPDTDDYPF